MGSLIQFQTQLWKRKCVEDAAEGEVAIGDLTGSSQMKCGVRTMRPSGITLRTSSFLSRSGTRISNGGEAIRGEDYAASTPAEVSNVDMPITIVVADLSLITRMDQDLKQLNITMSGRTRIKDKRM
jgi:hypothetical protein